MHNNYNQLFSTDFVKMKNADVCVVLKPFNTRLSKMLGMKIHPFSKKHNKYTN